MLFFHAMGVTGASSEPIARYLQDRYFCILPTSTVYCAASLKVTSRGYMLGYNDLRDPSVSGFFRFLAKVGDGMMKMQIVKIGFGKRRFQ
ncbi:MAG: hypothetical protein ACLR6B_17420 [Blautia sp.]